MPRKSTIGSLPDDIRAKLESQLIAGSYLRLADLCEWLKALGFTISVSGLDRHKKKLCAQPDRLGWLDNLKEPGKLNIQELEKEVGFLSVALARIAGRKLACEAEIARLCGCATAPPHGLRIVSDEAP